MSASKTEQTSASEIEKKGLAHFSWKRLDGIKSEKHSGTYSAITCGTALFGFHLVKLFPKKNMVQESRGKVTLG